MNRTQKFALNSLTSMISQIVVMAAGMITPRLMIATYGSEMNGLVSSLNQFISYITLVEAGIGGAAIYSLYKPLAEEDHARISSIVVAAKELPAGRIYFLGGYFYSGCCLWPPFECRVCHFWYDFYSGNYFRNQRLLRFFLCSGR